MLRGTLVAVLKIALLRLPRIIHLLLHAESWSLYSFRGLHRNGGLGNQITLVIHIIWCVHHDVLEFISGPHVHIRVRFSYLVYELRSYHLLILLLLIPSFQLLLLMLKPSIHSPWIASLVIQELLIPCLRILTSCILRLVLLLLLLLFIADCCGSITLGWLPDHILGIKHWAIVAHKVLVHATVGYEVHVSVPQLLLGWFKHTFTCMLHWGPCSLLVYLLVCRLRASPVVVLGVAVFIVDLREAWFRLFFVVEVLMMVMVLVRGIIGILIASLDGV